MQNEEKIDLKDLEFHELESFLKELGEPKFRAKQIFSWIYKGADIDEMTNLSKATRQKLSEIAYISKMKI